MLNVIFICKRKFIVSKFTYKRWLYAQVKIHTIVIFLYSLFKFSALNIGVILIPLPPPPFFVAEWV